MLCYATVYLAAMRRYSVKFQHPNQFASTHTNVHRILHSRDMDNCSIKPAGFFDREFTKYITLAGPSQNSCTILNVLQPFAMDCPACLPSKDILWPLPLFCSAAFTLIHPHLRSFLALLDGLERALVPLPCVHVGSKLPTSILQLHQDSLMG
jgi:hypothetical protein